MTDDESTDERAFHRERAVLYLAVGVALVLTPTVVGSIAEEVTPGDQYTYEAVEVTAEDGRLVYEGRDGPPGDAVRGVDCYAETTRDCALDAAALDGNATREVPLLDRAPEPYAHHDGRFYERTRRRVEEGAAFGLRPVSARTVLDSIAIAVEETDDPASVRRIATEGTATVDHALAASDAVVRIDGAYYVFDFERAETPVERPSGGVRLLAGASGLFVGLWSLRRGWVQYDRWREGD